MSKGRMIFVFVVCSFVALIAYAFPEARLPAVDPNVVQTPSSDERAAIPRLAELYVSKNNSEHIGAVDRLIAIGADNVIKECILHLQSKDFVERQVYATALMRLTNKWYGLYQDNSPALCCKLVDDWTHWWAQNKTIFCFASKK